MPTVVTNISIYVTNRCIIVDIYVTLLRMRSQTPSYVDETLFGSKPVEPSFKPPWDSGDDTPIKHLLWSPQGNIMDSPRSIASYDERPGSRLVR